MSTGRSNRGGEHPENRLKMERMTGHLVETGMDRDRARTIARDCALRQDGDLPGGVTKRDRPQK